MKISIVGVGKVGSTIAHIITLKGLCDHLVLDSRDATRVYGDVLDLRHSLPFAPKHIKIDAEEAANSDIVILCASYPSVGLSSRNQLLDLNRELFQALLPNLVYKNPNAIYLIITNPVDIMTYDTLEYVADSKRVLGISTLVDSARFRTMLADHTNIHPDDLRAYIVGEHGPNQFPLMSTAMVGGEYIQNGELSSRIFDQVVQAGFEVSSCKGYTNYAVANATCYVVECIVNNSHKTVPLSVLLDGYLGVSNICMSVPVVVGREGVSRILHPTLSNSEQQRFLEISEYLRSLTERTA